ncbi:MAG: type II secretion system protein [bacterium]|nr:type II secretion system protein [bacterium]
MKAFTLAEVLITLAIIGVVAAISIPSVISNSQQQEFKTGLRKAVSVLNSAITMNMALDGETPYDNANLFGFFMRHMSVMKTETNTKLKYNAGGAIGYAKNSAFYTTDGMKFEFRAGNDSIFVKLKLYESGVNLCGIGVSGSYNSDPAASCGGCGSYGLNNNPDNTTKPPCLIMVDVNGDRKPNPSNINCKDASCLTPYKFSDPDGKILTDMFTIMVTDREAIPYGTAAQKAMYQNRKF